jgi:hypothetical protein
MILDIALIVFGIIAIATGYNRGALATLFSIVGYFGGGVAGFALVNWYTSEWKGLVSIIALHLFGIFAGANVGRWILWTIQICKCNPWRCTVTYSSSNHRLCDADVD